MAQRITRRMFIMLNRQGNRELEASMMYYSMALWFDANNLPGSKIWCKTHSEEERKHSYKFFEHLSDRRIVEGDDKMEPIMVRDFGAAKQSDFKWEQDSHIKLDLTRGTFAAKFANPVDVWKAAYIEEQENSKAIHEILTEARKVNDYTTEKLITGFFLEEQLEEEKAVEEILTNAQLVTARGPDLYFELDRRMPSKPH